MPAPSCNIKRSSNLNDEQETIRSIVFRLADIEQTAIGRYQFALPVEAVIKAIVYPATNTKLTDGIGMINLGDRTVTIVDLRHKFTTIDVDRDSSRFLILFKTQSNELCGLPVKDAPTLLDIPIATIRPIPLAYREVNQFTFASHVAIVPQDGGLDPLEILLLGMGRSIPTLPASGSQERHLPELN
jgi:chemotaxis signal transduction protein